MRGSFTDCCALQLRKAVVDHVSDSFLETNVPLLVLIEAAKSGNEREVEEYAQVFTEHANKLVEVTYMWLPFIGLYRSHQVLEVSFARNFVFCPLSSHWL